MKKMAAVILGLGLGALLTGCEAEQTEKDLIAEAQFCMDDATNFASANQCLRKISGLTSPQAYALRCAGGFIAAEVTSPAKLSKALNAIKENEGTAGLLAIISFPDTDLADSTFQYCNNSNQGGMKLMGALAKSATYLGKAAGTFASCSDPNTCDTAQMNKTLTDLATALGDPNDPRYEEAEKTISEVISSVQGVYGATCSGTHNVNSDICQQINDAVGGYDFINATPEDLLEIGKNLLAQWQQ